MKILISGYGTSGKNVAELAQKRGHEIVGTFSLSGRSDSPFEVFSDPKNLPDADVIIDFSHPSVTEAILREAESHKIPMVIATTGEREKIQKLMDEAAEFCPVFFSANMSYGLHIVTEILKFATPLLKDFDIEIMERHHNRKVDAPSGTAIKLLEAIQSVDSSYYPIYDRSQGEHKRDKKEIGMSSMRGGTIVGEHEILFAGADEVIELTHRVQSNKVFADGAISVAEKLKDAKPGMYTFQNL